MQVEGLDYFADTFLFGGVILSLARAITALPPLSADRFWGTRAPRSISRSGPSVASYQVSDLTKGAGPRQLACEFEQFETGEALTRIFVAGAAGAIGKRLVPLLVACGHDVVATTRSRGKFDSLRAFGVEPVLMDGLNHDAVMKAVVNSRPDVIVHQMTSLASIGGLRNFDREFAITSRLRTEGTEHLLAASRETGARKFVAQSYAGWPTIREGGRIKTENDPLDPSPPRGMTQALTAIRRLESLVTGAKGIAGIVLRYGGFYGPGTAFALDGTVFGLVRQRKFPLIGDGAGVWSFIHVDDAAVATRLAIERGAAGIYNVVDDDPAEVSVWLPELARILGAKPPRHVPAWLGRLLIGDAGLSMMTRARGSSNAKAKTELNWQPKYASWRGGFRAISRPSLLPDRSSDQTEAPLMTSKGEKRS